MDDRVRRGGQMPDRARLTEMLTEIEPVSADLDGPAIVSASEERPGRVRLIKAIRRALMPDQVVQGDCHEQGDT